MRKTSVEISDLSVRAGDYTILSGINLAVETGSCVSIVGPNGGGKTTLLKVMLGLIRLTSGTVNICGYSLDKAPAGCTGYIPQIKTHDISFPATALELAVSGITGKWPSLISKTDKIAATDALAMVGAEKIAKRQLSKLSGGELQKVFFARAIVRVPKLLLLDEPATGVDFGGEKDISRIIDDYKKSSDATVIMVTHDWESAYHHSDYILMLNRTNICFDVPSAAFSEENVRKTFGHIGHDHEMLFSIRNNLKVRHDA
jgi:zinc transport system ATP-binding protein